jgi:hypothetical protein
VLVAVLVVVLAMAGAGCPPGARVAVGAEMTAIARMDGWLIQVAVWAQAHAVLIIAMWLVIVLDLSEKPGKLSRSRTVKLKSTFRRKIRLI